MPAISVNKGYCSIKPSHYSLPDGEPWGNSGWKQDVCHLAVNCCRHPPWCALRRLRMRKRRTLAPDSWGAYQRNYFSEPRFLHLPICRKVLNTLTWDIWFSLINNNLLMFWLPGLCCKSFYIFCFPSLLLQSSLSVLSEMQCPGLKSSVLSAKENIILNFLGCAFFKLTVSTH